MMEIYGVTSEEVREDASPVFSRLHPEDVDYIVSSIQESARTQELYHSEYRVILPGQGVRWRLCDANPERLDDGSTLWYGIITDITDRKLAEETIRQSEVRYRSLLTNLDVGVVVHSPDTKITKYNSKAIEILGLSDEQMLGKTAIDPQWTFSDENGETLPLAEFPVNLVVSTKQPLKDKLMGVKRTRDDKIVWISVNGMPVINANGDLSEIVISFIDITERKQAELVKHIQYNIARSILTAGNLDDFLMIIKNELGKLLDTINFFVALYDPEKDILKKLIYHDQTEDCLEWPADRSLSGQVVKSGKSMLMKRDEIETFITENRIEPNGTIAACWLGVPITIQNVVSGAMVIQSYNDTNAYKAGDQTLLEMVAHEIGIFFERRNMLLDIIEAKEKAEESDKLKTAFIQNISHEIRTPLNGILGFGRLWAEADLSQAEREKYFETVQNSSLRLLNTVTDYMDMALIVSGTMKLNKTNFLLTPSLELICETISSQSHEKNIEFETIFPGGHDQISLHSDVELIRKIIKELADNAIKFTKTGKITLGFTVIDGFLKFYLKDTGTGISSEKVTVIFDMFTQEEMAMTRGHEGSGLGLSISKGIVGLLGGKIWLESEKGQGSTFYFTIPYDGLATTAEPAPKREPVTSVPGRPMILLAEDDESNYLYFKVIMNRAGCDHLHARNGEEAVELCKQNPDINFVLMDIKMPVMNGLEATKRIREFRTDLPVIALTAYAQTGDEQRILAAGCDEYLPKPIKPEDLKSLIRKYANTDG
jgi:PAS domain S-box-containing protein